MIHFFPTRRVALEVFGFSIYWYGLLYLVSFLMAYKLLPRLQKYRGFRLTQEDWSAYLSWAVMGVLVGGRLGYVLFYAPHLLADNPLEIVKVWHGGMSSHGGFIGVLLCTLFFVRSRSIPLVQFADVLVVPVALGLALGRVGNFINLELYGSVTHLPWGIRIPGVEGLRHPTQLYAVAKDLCIATLCYRHLVPLKTQHYGKTCALFLMLYGMLRFLIEFIRVQDYPLVDIGVMELTRGQVLTIPVFVAGVILWRAAHRFGTGSTLTRCA
ncbi:prolipoprotein diacylglyceryl transferase [Candidatus Peregrinibacteria bacterium CG10_big_fil_rev_8_21_14_0_10_49_10]|nr:MAG: prolipoprotein diacylglyceryl transferase [Candidatus Peregrinibacteria bacterium CG10_big_fil_rev_8_21_14_0_10_49_10]